MPHWQVRLNLHGALATPLHSGTLFGHLCWAYREVHSDEALSAWLATLPSAPFLISDAFPSGFVPKPILRASTRLADPSQAKQLKRLRYIPLSMFQELRSGISEGRLAAKASDTKAAEDMTFEQRVPHNRIDRHTGTTPQSGGLFFTNEFWPSSSEEAQQSSEKVGDPWEFYVSTDLSATEVDKLFAHVGNGGFGKDAALGRGRFHVKVEEAPKELFEGSGNRWMTLSHGSLTPNMGEPRYRLHTHYGKLGPALANHRSPFKYPITVLEPGSTFSAGSEGPYGEMLMNMHPDEDLQHIVHNAWHLVLPFSEVYDA